MEFVAPTLDSEFRSEEVCGGLDGTAEGLNGRRDGDGNPERWRGTLADLRTSFDLSDRSRRHPALSLFLVGCQRPHVPSLPLVVCTLLLPLLVSST